MFTIIKKNDALKGMKGTTNSMPGSTLAIQHGGKLKMRGTKADRTVKGILVDYIIQYFERQRHCRSSSGFYKLWPLETSSLQIK